MVLNRTSGRAGLPFVFLNVASTLDGKLAPADRVFVPFGSKRDQDLLLRLRTRADAVMAGARTVDLGDAALGPGGLKYRKQRLKNGLAEYNLRVVVSGSGTIDTKARIFRQRFSPIIILTTGRAGRDRLKEMRSVADEVKVFGKSRLNFTGALQWLREQWNVKRLLCEGGGELNDALFREDLVDEVWLTLCPRILGGRNAPTMADGAGADSLLHATRLELTSMKRAGDELFLVYRVLRKSKN